MTLCIAHTTNGAESVSEARWPRSEAHKILSSVLPSTRSFRRLARTTVGVAPGFLGRPDPDTARQLCMHARACARMHARPPKAEMFGVASYCVGR
eukprot:NODE_6250_length_463_cov_33.995169_g4736_i0.p2 GENE.NODE_6250_length_463_cov_33.995169_g4736_i0~~NODE_6250_length_463_cov_33.995169_g4736_i0.p2  ORF type:complete len:110 (+),score=31.22 NODE_6250_length_463_cov_33.995169_g4736_i0:46-330(+)